jgi:hypothetical protein
VKTAILIPTCEASARPAAFILKRLDACWPGHPEVFVCGIAGSPAPVENLLPLVADPRDWVGIALDAVTCLQQPGVEWLYRVLDDHPPFEHVVVDIGEVRQLVAAAGCGPGTMPRTVRRS